MFEQKLVQSWYCIDYAVSIDIYVFLFDQAHLPEKSYWQCVFRSSFIHTNRNHFIIRLCIWKVVFARCANCISELHCNDGTLSMWIFAGIMLQWTYILADGSLLCEMQTFSSQAIQSDFFCSPTLFNCQSHCSGQFRLLNSTKTFAMVPYTREHIHIN